MEENSLDPSSGDEVVFEDANSEAVLLSEKGCKYLSQTRPWVRFMSIIVFIGAGFMILGGLAMMIFGMTGAFFSGNNTPAYGATPGGSFAAGIVYIILSVLYIAPGIFLSRYASSIKILDATPSSEALERALRYQKSFWRYVGVLTVIMLVIMAAAIAFSFAIGIFMFLNR